MFAADACHVGAVEALHRMGADLNAATVVRRVAGAPRLRSRHHAALPCDTLQVGTTALHVAVRAPHSDGEVVGVVEKLIELKANIDATEVTVLMFVEHARAQLPDMRPAGHS
jgi:hypothetical protein